MREESPTRNKKWGILKYFFVEISFEKSETIQDHWTRVSVILGQKMRYDIHEPCWAMTFLQFVVVVYSFSSIW